MRSSIRSVLLVLSLVVMTLCGGGLAFGEAAAEPAKPDFTEEVTQGALRIETPDGGLVECPLKHTDVSADVSGFIARVTVRQTFFNPLDEKIEAVYVFPLPHRSAVDEMTMVIGDRRIVGVIRRRADARAVYEEALSRGATAALLEQERPNIFVQSVGNIAPQQQIDIEISYVDVLEYDMGVYEFHFPMVVGPRYNAGGAIAKPGGAAATTLPAATTTPGTMPAEGVNPPVLKPGMRNGHDISLELSLEAGVPVRDLTVANHTASVTRRGDSRAKVELSPDDTIPNKDFVLRYAVRGEKPEMALLAHGPGGGPGYFMLMVQPREDERLKKGPPRELVFLIDVSGSMSGAPTAKVKDAMSKMLKLCRPTDTVQVITFAGSAKKLFEKPVPVVNQNITTALNFTQRQRGGGGTNMLLGIKAAIDEPADPERVRIVVMLTDGYIGNEAQIIEEVGRRCGDRIRFWCIGMGQSPNRFLTDGVARQGGGMSKVLGLDDDTAPLVQEIMFRIQRAQLANVKIDWGGLDVYETYPARIPELWAGRPIILYGLYGRSGFGDITISGLAEGEPVDWTLPVVFPSDEPAHEVLSKVWARQKIEDLMQQTYYMGTPEVEELVTGLALEYRLMSQYTSFVAVDETTLGKIGERATPPRRMLVPVPIPEGTRFEGFFGDRGEEEMAEYAFDAPIAVNGLVTGFGGRQSRDHLRGRKGDLRRAPRPMRSLERNKSISLYAAGTVSGPAAPVLTLGMRLGAADDAEMPGGEWKRTARPAPINGQELLKKAKAQMKAAGELKEKGALAEARALYAYAYILDDAAISTYASNGEVGAEALEKIDEIDRDLRKAWSDGKTVPGLATKLDLVIRRQVIGDALAAVAKAAGLKIVILPGSDADAAALAGREKVTITYLDLRHATVTQALDWITQSTKLSWWVDDKTIVVGSTRRGPGTTAWVYDLAAITFPLDEKLKDKKPEDQQRITQKAADEVIAVIRAAAGGDGAVDWYAPGQAVVMADAKAHRAVAGMIEALSGAPIAGKLPAPAAGLRKVTMKRAAARREMLARSRTAAEQRRVLASMNACSWRLLAAAARGEIDDEALTELQASWENPAAAEAVAKSSSAIPMRSLWAIRETRRSVVMSEEETSPLSALVWTATRVAAPAAKAALATLEKSPNDVSASWRVLYAAMAMPDDGELVADARRLIDPKGAVGAPLVLRTIGRSLLVEPDGRALAALLGTHATRQHIRGEDAVALMALACRRAGGEAWLAFRREARGLLGNQGLPGGVIVLVNSLERTNMAMLAE